MTTEKMPDEMYVTFELPGAVYRYTRAEPIEALLKQARDAMEYIGVDDYCDPYYDDDKIDATITAINKFLGDK